MGITIEGNAFPESTGEVILSDEPVTTAQTPGHPVGTGAVDGPDKPVTTEFGPTGQDSTGDVEVPERITYRNPSVKVVRPPAKQDPEAGATAETPESQAAAESRRAQRAAERAAQPADADTGR